MNAAPSDPKPTAEVEPTLEQLQKTYLQFCELRARGMWTPLEQVIVMYRGNSNLERLDNTHLEALFELAAIRSDLAAAQKRYEAAEAEHKKVMSEMLAMLNVNQARAQSAAQSAAKIAQELQIYLRENTPGVVKLEA